MLEKGKGPIVDKLKAIQLIEIDLQLLMRILINTRNKSSIELDLRISKSNYSLRANYLIENAILEKRLWYDNSLLKAKSTIHNMTNLQAYYDRQLPKIGAIVEESVGIEHKPIQLIVKVLPIMKHYIFTSYRDSL